MVEIRWPELSGKELRYRDKTWKLTGTVDVRGSGESLEVTATEVHDVKHSKATLQFNLRNPPASLNPGDFGTGSTSLEREDDRYYIVIEKEHRTYRYEIGGLQYE